MSDAAHHDDAHDDPWSHVPPPSFWPFGVGIGLVICMCATVLVLKPGAILGEDSMVGRLLGLEVTGGALSGWQFLGVVATFVGVLVFFVTLMGWCHQVIREKRIAHDLMQQQNDLKMFIKLFLVSELMAFAAVFAYYYIQKFIFGGSFHQPDNLHIGGSKVAIATMLLLSSSVTCEFAHHAVAHGEWGKARLLMLSTLILGTIFIGFQGMEYGELIHLGFWPGALDEAGNPFGQQYSSYAATFFIATGFHGFHVLTGLVMLFLVYVRVELGHYTKERHYSLIAASWYWHFVDIVWILLFITVYVM